MKRTSGKPPTPILKCAIYTRKSTEEGLDQDFNSLDAQRESGEAYVLSQRHEGWECVPTRYDDGGFTGGNMDRPALRHLIADIESGKVNCVVVYKVDRLSRSLLDFARLMEVFDKHGVSFVSVTQQFNTASSMGRLVLNVLLSFAQFEREIISERTRDKIAATRRRGKWSGGMPLLGFDVVETKLVVNPVEAEQVRQMFELYLEKQSLLATCEEANRRGWTTKIWTTKKKLVRGGYAFGKNRLHQLLTNVTYIGKVRYKDEVHEGEHEAIVDGETFRRTQQILEQNGASGGRGVRNKHGALLSGLLHCSACDCGMTHSFTCKGTRRYRYYVCNHAQQRGWKSCPAPSLPAGEIENFVVDQIRCIGRDPALVAATVAECRRQAEEAVQRLKRERGALERKRRGDEAETRRRGAAGDTEQPQRIEELMTAAQRRLGDIGDEISSLVSSSLSDEDIVAALADFDAVWNALTSREQTSVLSLLVERIDYDAAAADVIITFRSNGIKALGDVAPKTEEAVA